MCVRCVLPVFGSKVQSYCRYIFNLWCAVCSVCTKPCTTGMISPTITEKITTIAFSSRPVNRQFCFRFFRFFASMKFSLLPVVTFDLFLLLYSSAVDRSFLIFVSINRQIKNCLFDFSGYSWAATQLLMLVANFVQNSNENINLVGVVDKFIILFESSHRENLSIVNNVFIVRKRKIKENAISS